MSNGLDAMGNVLGLVIVGGVAMKMTESMFGQTQQMQPRKRKNGNGHKKTRRDPLLHKHPGNFGNVWF
jgi:hypothetical protein